MGVGTSLQAEKILDSITDAFFAVDGEDKFIYINKHFQPLIGLDPKDLIYKNVWTVFSPKNDFEFYDLFEECKKTKEQGEITDFFPKLNRWLWIRIYPSAEGAAIYLADVSESKKQEDR